MAEQKEEYKAGRPFKFTDPAELRMNIQAYFDRCDPHLEMQIEHTNSWTKEGRALLEKREVYTKQEPYLITGLAEALGVTPETLKAYKDPNHYNDTIPEDVRQEIIRSIEDAYLKVHKFNERALYSTSTFGGAKFNLTNNFGWQEKIVNENTNKDVSSTLNELDDIADNAKEQLEDSDAGSETPE